jgi:hypothetical protein
MEETGRRWFIKHVNDERGLNQFLALITIEAMYQLFYLSHQLTREHFFSILIQFLHS